MMSRLVNKSDLLRKLNATLKMGLGYVRQKVELKTNEEIIGLLDYYGEEQQINQWFREFQKLEITSLLTWNNIFSVDYGENMVYLKHDLFRHMVHIGNPKPDQHTLCKLLSSSCQLRECKSIHGYAIRTGLNHSSYLNCSLITRYSKCSDFRYFQNIFKLVKSKRFDLYLGTTMIFSCGYHGMLDEALKVFHEMNHRGIRFDQRTMLGVLFNYNHRGLIDEYLDFFRSMQSKYGVKPNFHLFHNLVDTLSRVGRFNEAEQWISVAADVMGGVREGAMDELWRVVASHAATQGDSDMGFKAFNNISKCTSVDLKKKAALEKMWGKFSEAEETQDELGQVEGLTGTSSVIE